MTKRTLCFTLCDEEPSCLKTEGTADITQHGPRVDLVLNQPKPSEDQSQLSASLDARPDSTLLAPRLELSCPDVLTAPPNAPLSELANQSFEHLQTNPPSPADPNASASLPSTADPNASAGQHSTAGPNASASLPSTADPNASAGVYPLSFDVTFKKDELKKGFSPASIFLVCDLKCSFLSGFRSRLCDHPFT
jgi:hypothetical protein